MPSSLSSLLADKLGLSEEHAHTLLERLAEAIRDHADETGVHVSGLGTFRRHDETLTFEPEDALAQRVNQQFEGLAPEAAPAAPKPSAPAPDSPRAAPIGNVLTPRLTVPPADDLPDASTLQVPEEDPPGPAAVWAPRTSSHEEDSSRTPEPPPSDDETSTEAERAPSRRPSGRPSRDRSLGPRIVAAVLVVVFLLGAGWLVLGQQGLVPAPQSVFTQQTDAPASAGPNDATAPASPSADTTDTASSTAVDTTDTLGTPPNASQADGRWALVVASRDTRPAAEDQADTFRVRLADISLPINIRTAETDNTTRHRVVVGNFSSRDAALEAMDEHQSLLPEGVWLLRLE